MVAQAVPDEYPCPTCSAVFSSEQALAEHMRTHGGPQTSGLRCAVCGTVFGTEEALAEHALTHVAHPPPDTAGSQDVHSHTPAHETDPVGADYSCAACGVRFGSQEELSAHERETEIHPTPGEPV